MEVNYSVDMLFHFLDNNLNLNICKSWVNYLDDKSLLQPYLIKYSHDIEWVKLLLAFYPEIDYRQDNDKLLVSCCKYGHLEVVKWLVSDGANIRVNDYEPFRYTCQYGHLETAKYLFDLIDDIEEKKLCIYSNKNYALRWSAENGHLEVVKWLVNNGADIRVNDYEPFQYACEFGHLKTAKYLLSLIDTDDEEKKLCIESSDNYALVWSARYGHLEIVKWLVNNGADIRARDYRPFQCACSDGHMETAKYLFDLIDTDEERKLCVQSNDEFALKWSARCDYLNIVKWLVSNGANIKVNNYEPFRCACSDGHMETAKYLLDLIDDIEEKKLCIQSNNNRALRLSAKNGHLEVVKWLVNNGADFRANNYEPFQYACEHGYLETAKYLLSLIDMDDEEKKLCIESGDKYALIWSARYGHLEVVKWLVNNRANIRARDYEPFQYACEHGHLETAKYLLSLIDTDDEEKKVCIESGDNYALRWSARYGHLEVVKWLVNNGANVGINFHQCIRFVKEIEIRDYLLSQLSEEERRLIA